VFFHAVQINIEGNNIPFEWLIFTQSGVVAHHRSLFSGMAEAQLCRGVGTNVREINSAMPRTGDTSHTGVERFVQNHSNVAMGMDREQANQSKRQQIPM